MKSFRAIARAAGFLAVAALVGCGGGTPPDKTSPPEAAPGVAAPAGGPFGRVVSIAGRLRAAQAVGGAAPVITWTDPAGETKVLTDAAKEKPVLLVFWQTTCPICEEEIPHLNELNRAAGERVHLLAVNVRENPSKVADYVRNQRIGYPVLLDPRGESIVAYDLPGVPTLVVVGADGTVLYFGHDLKAAERALSAS